MADCCLWTCPVPLECRNGRLWWSTDDLQSVFSLQEDQSPSSIGPHCSHGRGVLGELSLKGQYQMRRERIVLLSNGQLQQPILSALLARHIPLTRHHDSHFFFDALLSQRDLFPTRSSWNCALSSPYADSETGLSLD